MSEALTDLCPLSLCPRDAETSAGQRLAAIGRDLRVVFLRLILTEDLTDDLPDPTQTWARFGDDNRADADGQPRAANPNDAAAGIDDDDDRPAARRGPTAMAGRDIGALARDAGAQVHRAVRLG